MSPAPPEFNLTHPLPLPFVTAKFVPDAFAAVSAYPELILFHPVYDQKDPRIWSFLKEETK